MLDRVKNNPKINPRGTVMGGNPRTHGKYGGMLNGRGLQHIEDQNSEFCNKYSTAKVNCNTIGNTLYLKERKSKI